MTDEKIVTRRDQQRIDEAIDEVFDAVKRVYVDDSPTRAFDEGRKIFIPFQTRITRRNVEDIRHALELRGIKSEIVFRGRTMSSVSNYDLVVWKEE